MSSGLRVSASCCRRVVRMPAIPTEVNGGNHTRAFADAARTPDAHRACYNVAKSLAAVGVRLLTDDAYFEHVSGDVFALIGLKISEVTLLLCCR